MKDELEPLSSELSVADLTDADDTDSKHSDTAGFEEDVLPFLLQAQDIVMKLESRVMELEEDLFTIHSKYEYDRSNWMIGLSQKDEYIEYLTQRLQKLEYSSRQAIVLLSEAEKEESKEMDMDTPNDEEISNKVSLSLSYLRQAQQINDGSNGSRHTMNEDCEEEGERGGETATAEDGDAQDMNLDAGTSNQQDATSNLEATNLGHRSSASTKRRPTSFCPNCKQLLEQLDHHIEEKAFLKRDLKHLAADLAQEQQTRANVAHAKENLESDVDELGRSLLKILNQIIMDEAEEHESLLRLNRQNVNILNGIVQAWDVRHHRLVDMKNLIFELDSAIQQSSQVSGVPEPAEVDVNAPQGENGTQYKETSPRSSSISDQFDELLHSVSDNYVHVDGRIFNEFTDHLKSLAEASKIENQAIPPTPFMKRIMREDIDPCLFADASGTSWWRSSWFRKKLIDNIATGRCEIQQWRADKEPSMTASSIPSPRLSQRASQFLSSRHLPPKTKCASCGRTRVCEFRMRLQPSYSVADPSQTSSLPWLPIDRFCRDRLVAVCDFYGFFSYLKQGLMLNVPVLSLFKQCMQHLRKMAVARVGSIGLFEPDRVKEIERPSRKNRESVVLDHAGSDSGSSVSISELTGIAGPRQIVIVH